MKVKELFADFDEDAIAYSSCRIKIRDWKNDELFYTRNLPFLIRTVGDAEIEKWYFDYDKDGTRLCVDLKEKENETKTN